MLEFLAGILYSLRRGRALVVWLMTAALIYPILTYVPDHSVAFYAALAIGIAGFAGGLYWESQSG